MKIELHEISIREIVENYVDNAEEGVIGYNGKLNIRPKYQREFVYDVTKRNAVIETIRNNFPLNVMYWVKNDDDTFEVLDGQQRTISFCQYVKNGFSIQVNGYPKSFSNLTIDEQNEILDYKLMVYLCEGTDTEKLAWFRIINIAGEKLTDQELRNATYTGTWLTNAKSIFSKSNCAAYLLSKDYVSGSPIRQELLEKALSWISNGNIEDYMSIHQHDPNANELWTYYRNVIEWVSLTFTTYRKEMKGIDWGKLYDAFKDEMYDTDKLEQEIQKLMMDDDVSNKKGIYSYILTHDEKYLNIRTFTESQKRTAYERQGGICPICKKHFDLKEMHGDHITPWSKGGKTVPENCQMLCADCNRRKSDI
ncbi:MAG: HNH endonuclease family protein [Eubacterium sp.]